METITAIMTRASFKQMIKSTKDFIDKVGLQYSKFDKIQLEFNKQKMTCKAVACDGFTLNVEEFGCINVQESFVAFVGADIPFGEDEDYIQIVLKSLFGDEQFEHEDVGIVKEICTISNPDKRSEITYIQTGYEKFDYTTVLPKFEKPFEIVFNPKLLIKALKAAQINKEPTVKLKFDTAAMENTLGKVDKPVIIEPHKTTISFEELESFKMVLPCRNDPAPNKKEEINQGDNNNGEL